MRGKMFAVALSVREKLAENHAAGTEANAPGAKRVYLVSTEYLENRTVPREPPCQSSG